MKNHILFIKRLLPGICFTLNRKGR